MYQNLPNILTLSRIIVIPIIVLLFFIDGNRWLILIIFSIAGITDFFDGYIARSQKKISKVGIFLDPVADKLLVATVILMLVAYDRITGSAILPALIILFREILVSGLREFLAQVRKKLPVSKVAKWKTAMQMIALGFLIIGDAGPEFIETVLIGEIGIWLAAVFTIFTGYNYLKVGIKYILKE
ncbi:MAG: CDP-diacylglycerol--glycerol-3-phosphate 3-phosphatidyltransferase [Rickettsiales bacterium]|nr:CDP-diacylglycerol--glycerol-3-phosphate 3-phosphatidyltransferase [Rickettsiales bacterium]